MFLWYKYLIVSLVISHLGFWIGNLFLITPFPDICLLVPFHLNPHAFMVLLQNISILSYILNLKPLCVEVLLRDEFNIRRHVCLLDLCLLVPFVLSSAIMI